MTRRQIKKDYENLYYEKGGKSIKEELLREEYQQQSNEYADNMLEVISSMKKDGVSIEDINCWIEDNVKEYLQWWLKKKLKEMK